MHWDASKLLYLCLLLKQNDSYIQEKNHLDAVLCKIKRKMTGTYKRKITSMLFCITHVEGQSSSFYWTDLFRFCMNSELVGFTRYKFTHELSIILIEENLVVCGHTFLVYVLYYAVVIRFFCFQPNYSDFPLSLVHFISKLVLLSIRNHEDVLTQFKFS
jgi:hypothetical protein